MVADELRQVWNNEDVVAVASKSVAMTDWISNALTERLWYEVSKNGK